VTYEYELYFGGDDPHFIVMPIETESPLTVLTQTEIANISYRAFHEAKKRGAIGVSFGQTIVRDGRGLPA
jgi:hypothetical protein